MRLEVVGGQNKGVVANDVTLTVLYRYTGTTWSLISGATATLPADTTQTTSIEFQPPIQNEVTELKLRIKFYTATVGTSFILREAKLYAVNECGEATYNQFKVHSEEEFYKVQVATANVEYDLSQTFAGYGKDRTISDASSFIQNGFNFSTKDRDHDTLFGGSCASSYGGGWWYSSCHGGLLTGTFPENEKTSLPINARGVGIVKIVGYHSSLQSLEMMIKPDTPYNNQGEGPIATVATCADLAAVSSDCARRCIDRPMVHGGQHAMGTCGRLVHAVLSRVVIVYSPTHNQFVVFFSFPFFQRTNHPFLISQVSGAPQPQHPPRTTCGGCHHTGTTNKAVARKSTLG
jgi:hypothetical protein